MNKCDLAHIVGAFILIIILCLIGYVFSKAKTRVSTSYGNIPINTQIINVAEPKIYESCLINNGLLATRVPGGYIYSICVWGSEWRPVFVPLMKTPFPCII